MASNFLKSLSAQFDPKNKTERKGLKLGRPSQPALSQNPNKTDKKLSFGKT